MHQGLRLAQRYQINERLADGELATVYRGQDLVLRRPIAVKAVIPDLANAYAQALRDSAPFAHPAAVCVYDAIEYDGWYFIVQEYVPGRPLGAYLQTGMPIERAVDLMCQVGRAITYAHARGVTHGDLTPAAVLVDRHANVRVNNFGLPPDETYFQRLEQTCADLGRAEADDLVGDKTGTAGETRLPSPQAESPSDNVARDLRALGYLLWLLLSEARSAAVGAATTDPQSEISAARAFRAEVSPALRKLVLGATGGADRAPHYEAGSFTTELEEIAASITGKRRVPPSEIPPAILAARALAAREAAWSTDETVYTAERRRSYGPLQGDRRSSAGTQLLLPDAAATGVGREALVTNLAPRLRLPSKPIAEAAVQLRPPASEPVYWEPAASDTAPEVTQQGGVSFVTLLALCAILFVLFFLVGFYSTILGR